MNTSSSLFLSAMQFVGIFVLMSSSALWLRYKGVIAFEHSTIISRMITDLVLPALVFYKMSSTQLHFEAASSIAALLSAEIVVGLIAWFVGRYLINLDRPSLGAFILASTFGSTNLMGSALVQIVFPGNSEALATGMFLSFSGVGIPLSSIGIIIAIYFGDGKEDANPSELFKTFLGNPVVLAFFFGIAWSYFSLPTSGPFLDVIFGALKFIGISLTFLVALLTGLTIKPLAKNDFSWPLISCSVLVLVLEPLLAYHFKLQNGNKDFSTILLLLLGSMPSSPLAIAFSLRYGCNVALASKLVVGTSIICGVTLPIISYYYS